MNKRVRALPGKNNWKRAIQDSRDELLRGNALLDKLLTTNDPVTTAKVMAYIALVFSHLQTNLKELEEIGERASELLDSL